MNESLVFPCVMENFQHTQHHCAHNILCGPSVYVPFTSLHVMLKIIANTTVTIVFLNVNTAETELISGCILSEIVDASVDRFKP